jgi:hypothetical protein
MGHRAAINFFALKGLKSKDIHAEIESLFGPEVLALATAKKWWRHFQ